MPLYRRTGHFSSFRFRLQSEKVLRYIKEFHSSLIELNKDLRIPPELARPKNKKCQMPSNKEKFETLVKFARERGST